MSGFFIQVTKNHIAACILREFCTTIQRMGFFDNIKAVFTPKNQRANLLGTPEWSWGWFGARPTKSGVAVNGETALAHAGVFTCAKILSESIASLPVGLYTSDNGQILQLTGDIRNYLISQEPHDLYTSYDFRATAMVHLALHGNFYADIIRDGNRRPKALRIIENPNWVIPELDINGNLWYRVYDYKVNGQMRERETPVRPRDIIHIKGMSTDGLVGKSPISIFRENIGLGIATTETQAALWKNGAFMSGYIKHPGKLSPDQQQNLSQAWQARYTGRENAGKTPILDGGLEFVPLMMKPADALFIETAKLSLQDIFRIYRIPMHMGGLLDRATNNNIEHQSLEFVRDTLRPILKNWENELDRKLLFENEKMRLFFRFNVDAMLRGDTQSRAEYYQRALGSVSSPGWMTPNEIRVLENLNPIADADTNYNPAMNNITPDVAPDNTTDNNGNTGTAQTGQ